MAQEHNDHNFATALDVLPTEIDTPFGRCYNQNQRVRMFVQSRGKRTWSLL